MEHHNFIIFLCYGSLWGEIRQSRLLPWAHKAELCILEDQLSEYGYEDFVKDFERNHLNIRYIAADGYYYIESNSIGLAQSKAQRPFVELFVFAKDRQVSHRLIFHSDQRFTVSCLSAKGLPPNRVAPSISSATL